MPNNIVPIIEENRMSYAQVGKIIDLLLARFRKFIPLFQLSKEAAQLVLKEEGEELASDVFDVIRRRIEKHSKIICRRVRVDRDISLVGLRPNFNGEIDSFFHDDVFYTLPEQQGHGVEEVDLYFLRVDCDIERKTAEQMLADAGLVKDPIAQIHFHIMNRDFAREYQHIVDWDYHPAEETVSFLRFSRSGTRCSRSLEGHTITTAGDWLVGRIPI